MVTCSSVKCVERQAYTARQLPVEEYASQLVRFVAFTGCATAVSVFSPAEREL
jgi:hypothetical protein